MVKKSVTIKSAWIIFSGAILAAIIYGLFSLFGPNIEQVHRKNEIDINNNENSPVSGNIDNQTNNFYQNDTNLLKEIQNIKNENKELKTIISSHTSENSNNSNKNDINTNLYIENMSGGVAVGKIENLNVTTSDNLDELLPFNQCVEVKVISNINNFNIEIKVNQGEWSPFLIGIPYDEKELIKFTIYDTKSSKIPGIITFQSSGHMDWEGIIEINNKKVKYWFTTFQTPILTTRNSIFINFKNLPSNIIYGIYPDKILVYNFDN